MIVSSGCNSNSRNDGVKCTNDRAGTLGPTSGRKTPIERKVAASFVGAVREPPEIRALLEAPLPGESPRPESWNRDSDMWYSVILRLFDPFFVLASNAFSPRPADFLAPTLFVSIFSGFKSHSKIRRHACLSKGLLPLPHLGECIQDGHPVSHGQVATKSLVFSRSCSSTSKARWLSPTPPG